MQSHFHSLNFIPKTHKINNLFIPVFVTKIFSPNQRSLQWLQILISSYSDSHYCNNNIIRMLYKNMSMTIRSSYNRGLLYCILNWTLTMMKPYDRTSNTEISPWKRRSKQVTYSRAVNSPCLQILRIGREGMIDDIIMHGTWCLLCKNILVASNHHKYVETQNVWKRCSWHTINPLFSPSFK